MEERHGVEVTGVCKICQAKGETEMHHIISQSKIEKEKIDTVQVCHRKCRIAKSSDRMRVAK